jgi:hypothetical protein
MAKHVRHELVLECDLCKATLQVMDPRRGVGPYVKGLRAAGRVEGWSAGPPDLCPACVPIAQEAPEGWDRHEDCPECGKPIRRLGALGTVPPHYPLPGGRVFRQGARWICAGSQRYRVEATGGGGAT